MLLVSQFTLYGRLKKNKPDYSKAMPNIQVGGVRGGDTARVCACVGGSGGSASMLQDVVTSKLHGTQLKESGRQAGCPPAPPVLPPLSSRVEAPRDVPCM